MSTYAISDIHGCFDELCELLDLIAYSDSDELYVLGDLIDRGPKNDECVKWMASAADNVHYLLGNHEQMMIWAMDGRWADFKPDGNSKDAWFRNGGKRTFDQCRRRCDAETMDAFQRKVESAAHLLTPQAGEHSPVLVHAGLRPPDEGEDPTAWIYQSPDDILWITGDWYEDPQVPPFDTVFGHTPTPRLAWHFSEMDICPANEVFEGSRSRIMNWNRKWAIDCGCVFGGSLGALRLEDRERFHVPCRKNGGYA